jgi:hypothetical protein
MESFIHWASNNKEAEELIVHFILVRQTVQISY